jgi:hypothetical protein
MNNLSAWRVRSNPPKKTVLVSALAGALCEQPEVSHDFPWHAPRVDDGLLWWVGSGKL